MAGMSWLRPPPVVAIGGTETFLRDREIRNAVKITEKSNRDVVRASTDAEVVDAIAAASAFGSYSLILLDLDKAEQSTVKDMIENQPDKTCLLLVGDDALDEKKYPVLSLVHNAYRVSHTRPTTRKAANELAVKFAVAEANSLLGEKGALDHKLAEAIVGAVGNDLGIVSHEISKMAAHARYEGKVTITAPCVRSLIRPSSELDMSPLRDALKSRNGDKVATALDKIRRNAADDPVMLLLRAKGGPADLALTWLRAAYLLKKGASPSEISSRLSVQEWALNRDILPAAQVWGVEPLRKLVSRLAAVDRGVLKGSLPSPWVSCETAILLGCQ